MSIQIKNIHKLIRENRGFRKEFSLAAPEIVEKIYALYANELASTEKIDEWIESNIKIVEPLYLKFEGNTQTVAKKIDQTPPPSPTIPTPVSPVMVQRALKGTIINIDRSEVAYKELIEKLTSSGNVYSGFTVVPDIKDGKAIWSLFFY